MTREDFIRQQQQCREEMLAIAKLYPECFTKEGKAIIAELTLQIVEPHHKNLTY